MTAETTAAAAASGAVTGTLNFTGWAGPTTYADFAKAFPGAKVNEIAWASADDTIAKAKGRAGDIDHVLVDGTTFPRLTVICVLAKLGDVANMSLVADQYKNTVWDPKNESFAATDHGRTGFVYRKDLIKETPTSWKECFALAPKESPVINPSADVVAKLTCHAYLGADQAKWDKVWDTFKAK